MKKIKFFLNPIEDIESWLNSVAKDGYRLKSVDNFLYDFEKTDKKYSYSTQFVGANVPKENKEYLEMLSESGLRTFRAPLNQGNIALFKVKFRPYAKGSAKLSNSFNGYNKEILIVEGEGENPPKLLSSNKDLEKEYKNIKNAYLQGFVIMILLFFYNMYKEYQNNFEIKITFLSVFLALISAFMFVFWFKANENYKKYKNESKIFE